MPAATMSTSPTAATFVGHDHGEPALLECKLMKEVITSPNPKALFINGEFTSSSGSASFNTYNPATGEVLAVLPDANKADVDRAVESARSAQPLWWAKTFEERGSFLKAMADRLEAMSKRVSVIEALDCGRVSSETIFDMEMIVNVLRHTADYLSGIDKKQGQPIVLHSDTSKSFETRQRYEPFGVVGMITPWNYPLAQAVLKLAPALASGNCVVLKPSEYASPTCLLFAQISVEVGLPKGVMNIVTGLGPSTGHAIATHPKIRMLSFTGSVRTGSLIMAEAAKQIKPVQLELGGKSPMVVMGDCDIDKTTDWIKEGIFAGSGQVCSATSRVLIHSSIYEKLCEKLKAMTEKTTIGPYNSTADLGPLSSSQQLEKVNSYLKIAEQEKLTVLGRSTLRDKTANDKGYYVHPVIFKDVPLSSRLWKEEIFGPVLCVRPFTEEADAIAVANDTEYGLGAAVMSQNNDTLARVSAQLESGVVWENCSQPIFAEQEFGGFKTSGIGREAGAVGCMTYLQTKTQTRKIE